VSLRTRVKFCGMTRAEDAALAVALGVDAIGLVFVPQSRRAVDVEQARAVIAAIPALVQVVGLFMDASAQSVHAVLSQVQIDLLQFHGSESAAYCEQFPRPYLKAIAMGSAQSPDDQAELTDLAQRFHSARGLLLDAHSPGKSGGSGEAFDWERIPATLAPRILLAGGLSAINVARAIEVVRPYAVDVSSGIESAPGIKCPQRMQNFMNEVNRVSARSGRG